MKRPVGSLPPRKPLTGPALPRRSVCAPKWAFLRSQTTNAKETTMWFRSVLTSLKPRSSLACVLRPSRRPTRRLWVEALEERSLPSATVTLAPSDDAPLVGQRVTWTATAVDVGATPVYQFSAAPLGGAFRVVRDFSPGNTLTWTP